MLVVHLVKTKKEFKNLCKTRNIIYIYRNELDKACFQLDMTHGKYIDFTERT